MQKREVTLSEILLMGITVRTNNQQESDPERGKIGPTVQGYFFKQLANNIPNRKAPGTTLSIYTEYESDHTGDYTYFIGEEVTSFDQIPYRFTTLIIPPQTYTKFTTGPGPIPGVVITAWQNIWQMTARELGGNRSFVADFEVFDGRTKDLKNAVVDIYIGIDK